MRQPRAVAARERREYVRLPLHGGLEGLAAEYRHHRFPRHVQDRIVIGLVQRGTIHFSGGGHDAEVREGDVLFVGAGTAHEAVGGGNGAWTYRALYFSPAQWEYAAQALGGTAPAGASIVRDPALYRATLALHRQLVGRSVTSSTVGAHLHRLVDAVAASQSRAAEASTCTANAASALARVRAQLDSPLGRRVSVREMAAMAGLSRFHFVRAFASAFGVSPYAYAVNARLLAAQRRLAAGTPISRTAVEAGFADQAHLSRHFLRTVGVTPGEYQRAFG